MASGAKDFWDKLGVVLSPIGGLLTAVAVAGVGFYGSHMLEKRQTAETNARLYSELMSKREESESGLRKDMLMAVVQSFLQPDVASSLDNRVLKLELLAYNFHESLDLRPLFEDLARRLHRAPKGEQNDNLLLRVTTVGREIANKQLFALEGRGRSFRRTVDFEEMRNAGRAGIALEPEDVTLEGSRYTVNLRALKVEDLDQQVQIRLEVKPAATEADSAVTRAQFAVSYFDFPLIDNTRLSNGQRCAVMLSNFGKAAAELTTICYPGEYASVKDRPYYDEVIRQLRQAEGGDGER